MYVESQQKELFSLAYVHAIAALAKCTIASWNFDGDSVDISLRGGPFANAACTEYPQIDIQLKCTSDGMEFDDGIHFPLKTKNYNDLRSKVVNPRMLVVVLVPKGNQKWSIHTKKCLCLKRCGYWQIPENFPVVNNTTSVTVTLPYTNIFSPDFLKNAMVTVANGGAL